MRFFRYVPGEPIGTPVVGRNNQRGLRHGDAVQCAALIAPYGPVDRLLAGVELQGDVGAACIMSKGLFRYRPIHGGI